MTDIEKTIECLENKEIHLYSIMHGEKESVIVLEFLSFLGKDVYLSFDTTGKYIGAY